MSSNQNKVTEGAKTKDAEICLLKLDHLRTIANFPDETGKYLVRNKKLKNALRIAVLGNDTGNKLTSFWPKTIGIYDENKHN